MTTHQTHFQVYKKQHLSDILQRYPIPKSAISLIYFFSSRPLYKLANSNFFLLFFEIRYTPNTLLPLKTVCYGFL